MEVKCQCILMQMDGLIVYQHKLGNMSWIRDFLTIQREGVCYDTQQFGFVMNEGSYSAVVALYRKQRAPFKAKRWRQLQLYNVHSCSYIYICSPVFLSCKGLWGLSCWGSKAVCRVERDEAVRKWSVFPLCWSRRAGCFSLTLREHSQKRNQTAAERREPRELPNYSCKSTLLVEAWTGDVWRM